MEVFVFTAELRSNAAPARARERGPASAAGPAPGARPGLRYDAAVAHHEIAVNQDMPEAGRRAGAVGVAGLVGDRFRGRTRPRRRPGRAAGVPSRAWPVPPSSSRAGSRLHRASTRARLAPSGASRVSRRSVRQNVPAVRGW